MKVTYSIKGMTCQHCVQQVEKVFHSMEGATGVAVSLEGKKADVEWSGAAPDLDDVRDLIEEAGFEIPD